jgi:hypothetical protein
MHQSDRLDEGGQVSFFRVQQMGSNYEKIIVDTGQ